MAVYLDNAATTRVAPEVVDTICACLRQDYGNPSSAHRAGIAAMNRIKQARTELLTALGDEHGKKGDILWTSGGTEADALAVMGAARHRVRRGKHIVTTQLEHPAVKASCSLLAREGFEVTLVAADERGVVSAQAIADAVREDTVLVACMLVNNEIGTVQPVADIAQLVRQRAPEAHVHCDAIQALGKLPLDVGQLGVDSLALSGHKVYGPKGVGALWLHRDAALLPLWGGGGQQRGLRSGTENVPGIAGLGTAVRLVTERMQADHDHAVRLRDRLVELLRAADLKLRIHGEGAPQVPHIVSVGIPRVPAEPLLHSLEARDVYVSAGSACAARAKGKPNVLQVLGVTEPVATLRISMSHDTTVDDIEHAARAIIEESRKLLADDFAR